MINENEFLKRFKVTLNMSTEKLEWDTKEKAYIGVDPDTWQDNGIIFEKTFKSLEDLINGLNPYYIKLSDLEYYQDEISGTRLEWTCDGEYHYSVPKNDQIPFIENYSAFIETVYLKDTDLQELKDALNNVLKIRKG